MFAVDRFAGESGRFRESRFPVVITVVIQIGRPKASSDTRNTLGPSALGHALPTGTRNVQRLFREEVAGNPVTNAEGFLASDLPKKRFISYRFAFPKRFNDFAYWKIHLVTLVKNCFIKAYQGALICWLKVGNECGKEYFFLSYNPCATFEQGRQSTMRLQFSQTQKIKHE